MKNAVISDVTPCGSCKNRRVGGTYRLHHQDAKNERAKNSVSSNHQPKHSAKKYYVLSSPILVTLMMEAIRNSETSVLSRTTRHNITEDGILHFPSTFYAAASVVYCSDFLAADPEVPSSILGATRFSE
jgi:hypothetical protein